MTGHVRVRDAYCDPAGFFNFTLASTSSSPMAVECEWSLNDPKSDSSVMGGEVGATLNASEVRLLSIPITVEPGNGSYDPRFYVMHVTVRQGGAVLARYSEQKSPYDWDYSTLPPKRKG